LTDYRYFEKSAKKIAVLGFFLLKNLKFSLSSEIVVFLSFFVFPRETSFDESIFNRRGQFSCGNKRFLFIRFFFKKKLLR